MKKTGGQGERKGSLKKEGGVAHVKNPRGIEPAKHGSKKAPLAPSDERSGKVGK